MIRRGAEIPQITDAPESLTVDRHRRERRYLVLMALRAICLVVATILVYAKVTYAWLWGAILVIGSLVLPWCAVLIANERSPRKWYRYTPPSPPTQRELGTSPSEQPEDHKIIDADL